MIWMAKTVSQEKPYSIEVKLIEVPSVLENIMSTLDVTEKTSDS